jgi:acyl transferase domain-containing protein
MRARLSVVASGLEDLRDKMKHWVDLRKSADPVLGNDAAGLEHVYHGNVVEGRYGASNLIEGRAGKAFLRDLLTSGDLERIASLWVLGVSIDWSLMYPSGTPAKVSLPTYPFSKERCWLEQKTCSAHPPERHEQNSCRTDVSQSAEKPRRTYYYPEWTLKCPVSERERSGPVGPILILDASEELFVTIKQRLQDDPEHEAIILTRHGTSFEEIGPDAYAVNYDLEEEFAAMLKSLKKQGRLPRVVLHHSDGICDLDQREDVAKSLRGGIYALFHLCKALEMENDQRPIRLMSVFSHQSNTAAPFGAAMSGFFKALAMENPRYLGRTVSIERGPMGASDGPTPKGDPSEAVSQEAGLILNELYDEDATAAEIRYRVQVEDGQPRYARYVSRMVEHVSGEREASALPLKQNGVYLITGGLGGLGLVLADYLARSFQSKLVLVGRSTPGASQQERLNALERHGAEILVVPADVSKLEDVEMVVREAKARFSKIDGVVHCAGVNRDALMIKKTTEEIKAVLAAKVYGAINLDLATSAENLELFVLFSSIAGLMGNVGQCDYAYGNRFLDAFAEHRENLRKANKRSGRTLSIDWSLWAQGGMGISADSMVLLEEQTGICPMPTEEGIRCWEELLQSEWSQGAALYGSPSRMAAFIGGRQLKPRVGMPGAAAQWVDQETLFAKTQAYLKELIGAEVKLDPGRIGASDRLESFGIDSVMISRLNARLERDLGTLPKTLFYEKETVRELATFLLRQVPEGLQLLFGLGDSSKAPGIATPQFANERNLNGVSGREAKADLEPIAIIGIHGHYPQSPSLAEYWENLKQGRDLIGLVPASRWNCEELFDPDPAAAARGKIYCRWGGFLDGHDEFDPQFFGISPEEASMIDPQERLFLESAWAAIEDAGYTRDRLRRCFPKGRSADVGVFVGVTTNSYHLWGAQEWCRGNIILPSSMPWSIANRISYFFDFAGPSLPVDTACSSSLVAIHLACESLRTRGCRVAIAGGVNLYLHPSKYLAFCKRRMLSLDGRCRSYGSGDDGFVPGEGIGTVVLKPLSRAVEDQDHVYAVIRASAFDHSGRSNGYSAPNPNSQANLIGEILEKVNIHPETIGFVEGHGTGTQLGDSIEIAALTQAFAKLTSRKQFCPIGSVKANIGHSESAAGIAGVAKVVLQMKHQQLAPSIHSDQVNSNIDFAETPFYVQHSLAPWEASSLHPRRALINGFGVGGVNACVILEDIVNPRPPAMGRDAGPYLLPLSAKNEERLREYVDSLAAHLRGERDTDLGSVCYTFQVGREGMDARLAIVASGRDELLHRLDEWSKQGSSESVYRGSVSRLREVERSPRKDPIRAGDHSLQEIARLWVAGEDVAWETLYPSNKPGRVPLPTYPFVREKYWVTNSLRVESETPVHPLHPLLSCNSSTLNDVSFTTTLSDTAFYAVDHLVDGEKVFPGTGFLEMACIAGTLAGQARVRQITDVVWTRPLRFRDGPRTLRTTLRRQENAVEYLISSLDDENQPVAHSEGKLVLANGSAAHGVPEERISIQALKRQCGEPESGSVYYKELAKCGFAYGQSFQPIQEIYFAPAFALSSLKIAEHLRADFGQFLLHPTMLDGALQTAAALAGRLNSTPCVPFALDALDIAYPVPERCFAYVEIAGPEAGVSRFNIRILNQDGIVLVTLTNLFGRALASATAVKRSAVSA